MVLALVGSDLNTYKLEATMSKMNCRCDIVFIRHKDKFLEHKGMQQESNPGSFQILAPRLSRKSTITKSQKFGLKTLGIQLQNILTHTIFIEFQRSRTQNLSYSSYFNTMKEF